MDKDEKTWGDAAHTIVRAAFSAIPGGGGPAQILFEEVFKAPLQRRREKWLQLLVSSIDELKQKVDNFDIEKLKDNDLFISTVINASQIAQRNFQKEQLTALINAIQNTACLNFTEADEVFLFLGFIEKLNPWHIHFIEMFDDLEDWAKKNAVPLPDMKDPDAWEKAGISQTEARLENERTESAGIHNILKFALSDFDKKKVFYERYIKELRELSLIGGNEVIITTSKRSNPCEGNIIGTTDLCQQFLRFIRKPPQLTT